MNEVGSHTRHPHLVLLQQLQLDRQGVPHLLVPLPLGLEIFLGALQFRHCGGIARPEVQLLQVNAVRVVLNPGHGRKVYVRHLQVTPAWMLDRKKEVRDDPPDSLVLFCIDHRVLDGLVDQRVHVRREGADGLSQSFATFGEKLLSLCIQTELHLRHERKAY